MRGVVWCVLLVGEGGKLFGRDRLTDWNGFSQL